MTNSFEEFDDAGLVEILKQADDTSFVDVERLMNRLVEKRRQRRRNHNAFVTATVLLLVAVSFVGVFSWKKSNPIEVRSVAESNSSMEAADNLDEGSCNYPVDEASRSTAAEQVLIVRARQAKLAQLEFEIELLKKQQSRQHWLLLREVASRKLQGDQLGDPMFLN